MSNSRSTTWLRSPGRWTAPYLDRLAAHMPRTFSRLKAVFAADLAARPMGV